MKNQTRITVLALAVFMLVASSNIAAQARYKVGDRVECDFNATGNYSKGTVSPFLEADGYNGMSPDSGKWYRVHIDGYAGGYQVTCKVELMRPLAAAAKANAKQNNGVENNQPLQTNRNNEPIEKDDNKTAKYKIGDRVECDITDSGKYFEKGTIAPFPEGDGYNGYAPETGYYYRVKLDRRGAGSTVLIVPCKANDKSLRPLAGGAPYKPETTEIPIGKVTVDENDTLSADRPVLNCPVTQPQAANGARPNTELLKKVLRCRLGEKPADKGLDGALTIDITAIQIGAPRKWDRLRDMGGGNPGVTVVYPAKVTYTEKTFYRGQTVVNENWIRIFNLFVNGFGEWQDGSAETIKRADIKYIPRDQ